MIIISIKSFGEAMYFTWWPSEPSLAAYKYILTQNEMMEAYDLSLLRSFGNTFLVVVPGVTVGMITSAMSAYTFAKFEFAGKKIMFGMLLSALMLPGAVMMVSLYLIYAKIGWVDTLLPLMIPSMFGSTSLVFALRQYMYGIPTDLLDSAKIDGANRVGIFIRIILPLSAPVLVAHWLLCFMTGYNDYTGPLLYIFSPRWETIQLTLSRFSNTIGVSNAPVSMAAATLSMAPLVVLYIASQKFFAKGILSGALKG
jgi:multiple sugar transport system permease protein